MLTPIDIENADFKKVALGYSQEEVDDFLDKVIVDFEKLYKDNAKLVSKINTLEETLSRYTKLEDSIKNAVILAEKTAKESKDIASERAENIINQAEIEAEKIINNANNQLHKLKLEITTLKKEYEATKAKLRFILESQLSALNSGSYELESTEFEEESEEEKFDRIIKNAEKNKKNKK